MILTKNEFKEELQYGIFNITFTKKDDTERIMRCTLLPKYVTIDESVEKNERKQSENTLVVWDLEADGFRSFTVANVTNFEKVN